MAEAELNWVAVYNDGTNYPQFNEDGTENNYHKIDREKLIEFHLFIPGEEPHTILAMSLEPEQRLIFRRRVAMDGTTGETLRTIYLVGWQQTIAGKNVQSINWILPDFSIINTGRFREDSPLFYEIVWSEEELVK